MQVFSAQYPGGLEGSYGSGTLLSADLVLTARHVLLPKDWGMEAPKTLNITVRSAVEARGRLRWHKAELVWPTNITHYAPDVALLRICDKDHPDVPSTMSLADEQDLAAASEPDIKVVAVGFPAFAQTDGEPRDTHKVSGITAFEDGYVRDIFKIDQLNLGQLQSTKRATADLKWAGFSGAGLFTISRHLIGVVVASGADGTPYDFRAERLFSLLHNPEFSTVSRQTPVDSRHTRDAPPIDQLVYLLDRDAQESAFARAYQSGFSRPLQASLPRPPLLCILPGAGEYRHAPTDVSTRLARKTLPALSAWPENDTFVDLPWPDPTLPLADAMADLRYRLWNALCGPASIVTPTEPQKYRSLWSDITRPRLFHSDATQHSVDHRFAQLVVAWLSFLAAAVPIDERRVTHLLMVKPRLDEIQKWRTHHRKTKDLPIYELAELQLCNEWDLADWLDVRLRDHVSPLQQETLSKLGRTLQSKYRGRFFAGDLKHGLRLALEITRD
jgi:hypothetical protein